MKRHPKEIWKAIPGYSYAVSTHGRVKNLKPRRGIPLDGILKANTSDRGYCKVNLYADRRPSLRYVHNLVAAAFLGRRPLKHEVDHVDGNKNHNEVWNLEYVTPLINTRRAIEKGLCDGNRGENHPEAKLTEKAVRQIRRQYSEGVRVGALSSKYGVNHNVICMVIQRRTWKSVK